MMAAMWEARNTVALNRMSVTILTVICFNVMTTTVAWSNLHWIWCHTVWVSLRETGLIYLVTIGWFRDEFCKLYYGIAAGVALRMTCIRFNECWKRRE